MYKILISLISLLMLIYVQQASALIVEYEEYRFDIANNFTHGEVKNITIDKPFNAIIIELVANDDGELTIQLPRTLIDAKNNGEDAEFIIVKDLEIIGYEEIDNNTDYRTLRIDIPAGTTSIEIVGTSIVPEFPIGMLILVIGISTIIILQAKTRML